MTLLEAKSEPVHNSEHPITAPFKNSNQKHEELNYQNLSNPKSTESP